MDNFTLEILKELEKTQHEFWNISHQTAEFISMLIKISGVKNILEIGTSNGYSTLWIADALKNANKDGHLTTIEFYEKRQCIAKENAEKCGLSKYITFRQGRALEIIENLDFTPDMVFIDANKREYVKYFNLVKPHLTPKAFIAADNIISHAEKVQTFIDAIDADEEFQYEILNLPGGLLTAFRNNSL